eukprot:CAMPEP_0168558834 /NCGR_PEP_ID=MMETSP0413-20121227/10192_1 /TAXON_ID=136452 /ORGANISM="Filamoeba nolandi, Strain NC-AS-23-1" /LENGTH=222 /DNA_ID=CAMNT_0008590003 /DNA_START=102 /DNA_END=770 /DNA_ORIENTATION=-
MSDSLIGLVGEDYVIVAAETGHARSIIKMKGDEDKIMQLDKYKLLAASGESGDRVHFCEYIKRNVNLFEFRHGYPMSVNAAANFTRTQLAEALRSQPYQTNLLFAGFDAPDTNNPKPELRHSGGPSLYFIDYLASLQKIDFAGQGYTGYFVLSIMDRYYKKGMKYEEGMQLVEMCIQQMQNRFLLDQSSWIVKVITKDGVKVVRNDAAQKSKDYTLNDITDS